MLESANSGTLSSLVGHDTFHMDRQGPPCNRHLGIFIVVGEVNEFAVVPEVV